jgi:hypothetical protein
MQRLSRLGLEVPPNQDDANFEGAVYETWLEKDFNRFLGEERTITVVHDNVAKNITDIIGNVPEPRSRADDNGSGAAGNATRERTVDIMGEEGGAEEPVGADVGTSQEEPGPSADEDAITLARADEEFEGAEILARIRDGIEHTAAVLTKLGIPADAELRAGNWLKRPIARLFEAATETMVENVGFQMGDLVSVKIGQEIHAHYRARLSEGLERAEFLSRISGNDSDSIIQTLEKPTSASREEYLLIGKLYEASVR